MSGAEEAPPTSNPAPAAVPSPDDSAKEVLQEQEVDVTGLEEEQEVGMAKEEQDQEEAKFIDVEGDDADSSLSPVGGRLGSVTIDPSYNPSGEELLYEGDIEAEPPLPSKTTPIAAGEKEAVAQQQDEGFMISVHETGMELDMAVSLSDSDTKAGVGVGGNGKAEGENGVKHSSSPGWRAGEVGMASGATPLSKSTSEGKSSPRPRKDPDRFVQMQSLSCLPLLLTGQHVCLCACACMVMARTKHGEVRVCVLVYACVGFSQQKLSI